MRSHLQLKAQITLMMMVVRRYRTVSLDDVVTLLARHTSWELQVEILAEVYWYRAVARVEGLRSEVIWLTALAYRALIQRWEREMLSSVLAGSCFPSVQAPGHGCLGEYLYKIARRETTPRLPPLWRASGHGSPHLGKMSSTCLLACEAGGHCGRKPPTFAYDKYNV